MDSCTRGEFLDETCTLIREGRSEEALVRHVWYQEHAVEVDPGRLGVRLSFALRAWVKLGEKYPKARRGLAAIRDGEAHELVYGDADWEAFHDVAAINDHLDERHRTVELFRAIHEHRPGLARECFALAEEVLAAAGEYALCGAYIPDPTARLAGIIVERAEMLRIAMAHPHLHLHPRATDDVFVREVTRLVSILAGAGRPDEAEQVRARALAVLDAPEIRRAVEVAA